MTAFEASTEKTNHHQICVHEGGGVSYRWTGERNEKKGGGRRGAISGASAKSNRAIRRYLLEHEVPGLEVWAMTLTIRYVESASVWRGVWSRWSQAARNASIPVVWRVELQSRGVPHVHAIVWGTEGDCEWLRGAWLRLWGVASCPDHLSRAVDIRAANGGWFGYVALHQGKHSVQSAGWEGRTWGVLCRSMFRPRATKAWILNPYQYTYARRLLSWIYLRRGRKHGLLPVASWDALGEDRLTVTRVCFRAVERFPDADPRHMERFPLALRLGIARALLRWEEGVYW